MSVSIKQPSRLPVTAPRPATVPRKRGKVRLLVPCGDRLPPGVLARLKQSPLDIVATHPTLSGVVLKRSDVVLLGDTRRLDELTLALTRMDALSTPIVAIGEVSTPHQGLELTLLSKAQSPENVADAVLKAVVRYLKPLGAAKRAQSLRSIEILAVNPEAATSGAATEAGTPQNDSSLFSAEPSPLPLAKLTPLRTFSIEAKPALAPPAALPSNDLTLNSDPVTSARLSLSLLPESFSMQSSRWLVLDDDVARAHAAASCLTRNGANVEVLSFSPSADRWDTLRAFDAVGALVAEARLPELAPLIAAFKQDPRLRWVRVLPVRWSELYDDSAAKVDEETLKFLLLPHWQVEHDALRDVVKGQTVPLDHVGPAKLLRAVGRLRGALAFTVRSDERSWRLTLKDGNLTHLEVDGQSVPAGQRGDLLREMLQLGSGTACSERLKSHHDVAVAEPLDDLLRCANVPPPVFETVPAVTSSAPDAFFDDNAQTQLMARNDLPLPEAATATAKNQPKFTDQARTVAAQATQQWVSRVWQPSKREGRALYSRGQRWFHEARPVLQKHQRLFSIGGGLCALLVLGGLVLGASRKDVAASSSVSTDQAGAPSPSAALQNAPVQTTPLQTAATPVLAQAAEPKTAVPDPEEAEDVAEPNLEPVKVTLSTTSQNTTRPSGCERWVGSEPVARQPVQATAAWRMARKSLMRGEPEFAHQRLCLSVHLDPKGPGSSDLIRYYFMQGDLNAALAWAQWVAKEQPGDAEAQQMLADALHQTGKEVEARELLLSSMNVTAAEVSIIKSVATKYANAGFKALKGSDPAQADRLFRRANALDSKNALANAGRATLLLRAERLDSALSFAQQAVDNDARSFEGHLVLGDVLAAKRDRENATKAWLTAAALRPGTREARERLGL